MRTVTKRRICALAVACGLLVWAGLIAGCATSAQSMDMKAQYVNVEERFPYSVHLFVKGGREYAYGELPPISDKEFEKALVESINESKVFASIGTQDASDYLLEVIIFEIGQWTFRTGARLEIGWRLTNAAIGVIVWQESIETRSEAGDQVASLEAAARDNIEQGLERISRLDL